MNRSICALQVTLLSVTTFLFAIPHIAPAIAADEIGHDDQGHEHAELTAQDTGPHGGRLLRDGDITVELALTGHGDGPTYQAWVTRNEQLISGQNLKLAASLTRLDGETLRLAFARDDDAWRGTEVVDEPHSFDITLTLERGDQQHQWSFASYEGRVEIAADTAAKAGVKSEIAGPGPINQTLTVYGRASADPTRVSHVRAPFPGIITKLNANIGEQVKAGQVLAEIESSDSLRRYELKSPLSGVVIARDGNPGELAQQQALLTVANYDLTWVEFRVFPGQASQVAAGQAVKVYTEQFQTGSTIKHLLPSGAGQPFLRARVPLDNPHGRWAPGLLLAGSITTHQADVPLRVASRAVQTMEGQDVVFIHAGEAYEARAVTLGLSDGQYTEILDGIKPGTRYVADNSYLIKADLEKAGAAHNH